MPAALPPRSSLALLFRILLDVPPRVGAVRSQAPEFGEVEHLGDDLEIAIGLVGTVPPIVMVFRDIGSGDIDDPQMTDSRKKRIA